MQLASRCLKSVEVTDVFQLQKHYQAALNQQVPVMLLGEASNALLPETFEGHVLWMRLKGMKIFQETVDAIDVEVGAGENWHHFVKYALSKGWYGLENLALIPGTVGASPVQNIGAYGVSVADHLLYCKVWMPSTGRMAVLGPEDMQFGYRDSVFKQKGIDAGIIVACGFRLSKTPCVHLEYESLQRYFKDHPCFDRIHPQDAFDAVVAIRRSKLPDVAKQASVGSFFLNPIVDQRTWNAFSKRDQNLLHHQRLPNGRMKWNHQSQ